MLSRKLNLVMLVLYMCVLSTEGNPDSVQQQEMIEKYNKSTTPQYLPCL